MDATVERFVVIERIRRRWVLGIVRSLSRLARVRDDI